MSRLAYLDFNFKEYDESSNPNYVNNIIDENKLKQLGGFEDLIDNLQDWKIIGHTNNQSGFSGTAFKSPTGEIVFAFRGTELNTAPDLITDLNVATSAPFMFPKQFRDAEDFVYETLLREKGGQTTPEKESLLDLVQTSKVNFTGHSLGGIA